MILAFCQVSFNPFNNMQLCVSGAGVFKLFRYIEGCLKQSSFSKVESINFLSHAWISAERVVAGTDTGRLLVFESGDLRRELVMSQGQADRSERDAWPKDVNSDYQKCATASDVWGFFVS